MTFLEKYQICETWHEKAILMEIYHLAMLMSDKSWKVADTASHFNCSIGLVSENLRLAHYIHSDASILKCLSRVDALKKVKWGRSNVGNKSHRHFD